MDAGGGFFGDAVDFFQDSRVFLVQQLGQVTAIVENHVGIPRRAVLQDGLLQAPLVLLLGFAFPGKYRDTGSRDGGSGLILGRKNVAGRPANFGAQGNQGFDQHGGLDGHMDATEDLRALERLLGQVLAAQAHQGRHFRFGDDGFATAPGCQGHIGDFVVSEICRRVDSAHREPPFVVCEWAPLCV